MELLEAINNRHSVRQYIHKPLPQDIIFALQEKIDECNQKGKLHIQLVINEKKAFDSLMAHYGKFNGVENYIALIGKKSQDLEEKCGYYGEQLVLLAQQLGLNTCWVAMTYKKIKTVFTIKNNEKLCIVIALGYGQNQGKAHRSKAIEDVIQTDKPVPDWFIDGVKAALLAPTAMNQQKFIFNFKNNQVSVKSGLGFYTKIDLGIVKYHYEIGANYHF